ncbi:histidine phosphatase family protein [Rossellomorea sp. YZS02]|uniref:histidine phosphatase family protein n=1 Tax=Rossellomorea sp. YZS02 TaxID=3097358 RepID=UPI002A240934|nr:histidine phosphatase family protein [Rossellomorea sp. YZS02]
MKNRKGNDMKTYLYLVRHAHSVYTPDELNRPLSERGMQDAHKLTNKLKNEQIEVVCSSPYKRAVQTVEGLANNHDILLVEGFKERLLSSHPVDDFDAAITKVWENPSFSFKGGESNLFAQERGVKAILALLEKYKGKRVAIGTHGNIMTLIMNHFDKRYDYCFWKELEMPDVYKLTFEQDKLLNVEKAV